MKRAELRVLLAYAHHFVVDDDGGMEVLAAVEHAVSDRADFGNGRYRTRFLVHKRFQYELDGLLMRGHILFETELSAVGGLLVYRAAVHSYAVAYAFEQHCFVCYVDELIFEGRTSRVYDQYVHISLTSRIAAQLSPRRLQCPPRHSRG